MSWIHPTTECITAAATPVVSRGSRTPAATRQRARGIIIIIITRGEPGDGRQGTRRRCDSGGGWGRDGKRKRLLYARRRREQRAGRRAQKPVVVVYTRARTHTHAHAYVPCVSRASVAGSGTLKISRRYLTCLLRVRSNGYQRDVQQQQKRQRRRPLAAAMRRAVDGGRRPAAFPPHGGRLMLGEAFVGAGRAAHVETNEGENTCRAVRLRKRVGQHDARES